MIETYKEKKKKNKVTYELKKKTKNINEKSLN